MTSLIIQLLILILIIGEPYEPLPDHEKVDISSDFKLQKDPATQYIYCCKNGQSINERKIAKSMLPEKP